MFNRIKHFIRNREFNGMNPFTTAKSVAKNDMNRAEDVKAIIQRIEEIKGDIKNVIDNDPKKYRLTEEDFREFDIIVKLFKKEAKALVKLVDDICKQNYWLIQKLSEFDSDLKNIFDLSPHLKKDKGFSDISSLLEQTKDKLKIIFERGEEESYKLARNIHPMFRNNNVHDLDGLADKIRQKEKELIPGFKILKYKIREAERAIEHISEENRRIAEKDLANLKFRESTEGGILKLFRITQEFSLNEASAAMKIGVISHHTTSLLIDVSDEIEKLEEFIKVSEDRIDEKEWCKKNIHEIDDVLSNIKTHELKWYSKNEALVNMIKSMN